MPRRSSLDIHPRDLILAALHKNSAPMTAYALLHELKPSGVKSAPIVYRALADLEKKGLAHKINALGAYVACNCAKSHIHSLSLLTVCHQCHKVKELHDHAVIDQMEALREMNVNLLKTAVIELPILCANCAA